MDPGDGIFLWRDKLPGLSKPQRIFYTISKEWIESSTRVRSLQFG